MRIYRNFPLSKILYYRIGGRAQLVIRIENKTDLLEALDFVKNNKIKRILPVGLGSNLLVSDKDFDGAVLWFSKGESSAIQLIGDNLIEAFSSVLLDDLIQFAFNKNLIGLEWAGGLPSTVGGAVRGNAGAFGGEIKDAIYKIETFELQENGEILEKEFRNSDLEFSYRDSFIKKKKNLIVATCFFELRPVDRQGLERAKQVYFSHIEYRNTHHPAQPSCGSVFKNIREKKEVEKIVNTWPDIKELVVNKWYNKVSTGFVINRLGFSGLRVGGAEVSKKHANYIVNIGGAKFDDVISIIERIRDKFSATFGFYPELEVEVVS